MLGYTGSGIQRCGFTVMQKCNIVSVCLVVWVYIDLGAKCSGDAVVQWCHDYVQVHLYKGTVV